MTAYWLKELYNLNKLTYLP